MNIILGRFHRFPDRFVTTGYDPDHYIKGNPEGGWDFRSIHNTQPATCACSHIKETAPFSKSWNYAINQFFDFRDNGMDSLMHGTVLLVDILQ